MGDVRLGFTDAQAIPGGWLYTASAEDSPDAIEDGVVVGSCIGRVDAQGARQAPLCLPSGQPLVDKVEGIAPGEAHDLVYLVTDPDSPGEPASLLLARLEGPWHL